MVNNWLINRPELFTYLVSVGEEEYVLGLVKEGLENLLAKNENLYISYRAEPVLQSDIYVEEKYNTEAAEEEFTMGWLAYQDGERTTIPGVSSSYHEYDEYMDTDTTYYEQEIEAKAIKSVAKLIVPLLERYQEWDTLQKLNYLNNINQIIDNYILKEYGTDEMSTYSTIDPGAHGTLFTAQVSYESRIFTEQLYTNLNKVLPISNIKIIVSKEPYCYSCSQRYTLLNRAEEKPLASFSLKKEDTALKLNSLHVYNVSDEVSLYLINYFLKKFYRTQMSSVQFKKMVDNSDEIQLKKNAPSLINASILLLPEENNLRFDGKDVFLKSIEDFTLEEIELPF